MRGKTILILAALAGVARGDGDETFLGWSPDGSVRAVHVSTCGMEADQVCADHDATLPGYGAVAGGDCVNSLDDAKLGELGRDGLTKLAPDQGGKPPAGVKVSYKASKTGGVVTVTAGKKKHSETFEDAPGTSLAGVVWRSDGKAVLVSIAGQRRNACDQGVTHALRQLDVSDLGLVGGGAGDRKAATAANNKGMGLYKKRQWKAALDAFRDAINADDSFVLPHYNLASVASITGQIDLAKRELRWLSKSPDSDAPKKLNKAMMDPDLDYASTDPEVRDLIQQGSYPEAARERLTERNGVWSSEGEACTRPAIQLHFDDQTVKGELLALQVTLVLDCKGKRTQDRSDEAWSEAPAVVALKKLKPILGGAPVAIQWKKCVGSEVGGSCFSLDGIAGEFHRGVPELGN